MKVSDLPPRYQKQIADKDQSEKIMEEDPSSVTPSPHEVKKEKELQRECENWLHHRGYRRLTAENVCIGSTVPLRSLDAPKGYFGHWYENRKNPFILDLLILSGSGHYLMVDFKTSKRYQPGQREIVAQGYGRFAYTFEDFELMVIRWEKEINSTQRGSV